MENFNEEISSIWSFKDRGTWSSHKGDYPGNCSPRVIRNLLMKYSKENDIVLDQFLGSGTTAIEALLLKRKIIGYDINSTAINISEDRIKEITGFKKIEIGNATELKLPDRSIDFICTHPPYLNIIKYSNDIKNDLSLLNKEDFYEAIRKVSLECYRVLKNNSKCAIIIGDIRKNGYIEPLGFKLMNIFLDQKFLLKEIIIKEQHNCKSTDKWRDIATKRNFLLIQHEYIFVFEKNYFK
jgi:DNA modification methylase